MGGNCRGFIYGFVKSSTDQAPIPGVQVAIDWIQQEGTSELKTAGNDAMTTFVPNATTTQAGEYVIPFYWSSVAFPGSLAQARAVLVYSDGSDGADHEQGTVFTGPDVAKQLSKLTGSVSPDPTSFEGAASLFLKFFMAATPELKALDIIKRFFKGSGTDEMENRALYSRIDMSFALPPKVLAVGTRPG
ncbi:MAG: hypothetical protein WBL61_16270 [Bryobacteraceae bacterium]